MRSGAPSRHAGAQALRLRQQPRWARRVMRAGHRPRPGIGHGRLRSPVRTDRDLAHGIPAQARRQAFAQFQQALAEHLAAAEKIVLNRRGRLETVRFEAQFEDAVRQRDALQPLAHHPQQARRIARGRHQADRLRARTPATAAQAQHEIPDRAVAGPQVGRELAQHHLEREQQRLAADDRVAELEAAAVARRRHERLPGLRGTTQQPLQRQHGRAAQPPAERIGRQREHLADAAQAGTGQQTQRLILERQQPQRQPADGAGDVAGFAHRLLQTGIGTRQQQAAAERRGDAKLHPIRRQVRQQGADQPAPAAKQVRARPDLHPHRLPLRAHGDRRAEAVQPAGQAVQGRALGRRPAGQGKQLRHPRHGGGQRHAPAQAAPRRLGVQAVQPAAAASLFADRRRAVRRQCQKLAQSLQRQIGKQGADPRHDDRPPLTPPPAGRRSGAAGRDRPARRGI